MSYDELTEVKRRLAALERTHAGDHRGFIASRRTILAQRDELQARLEAVRAATEALRLDVIGKRGYPLRAFDHIEALRAAADRAAAPQPEPDLRAENLRRLRQRPCCRDHADATPEPPASDEPARCEHLGSGQHWSDGWCDQVRGYPGPATSGTPDGSA